MHSFRHQITPLMGYRVPSTAGINADEPLLQIGHAASEMTLLQESFFFPKKIQLRATIEGVPLPVSATGAEVTLISQGEALQSAHLYHGDQVEPVELFVAAAYQAIKLVYAGQGTYQTDRDHHTFQGGEAERFRLILPVGNVLYTKPFAWEARATVVERVTQMAYGHVFTHPPGKMDVRVLHPYGGCFRPHLSADKTQQVYYELGEKGKQTAVLLKVEIPENAVILPPPTPEQTLSLGGALAAGYGKIYLQAGQEKRVYQSVASHHPGDNPFLLDVSFIPRPSL